jgi:hypothetical protein
MFPNLRLMIVAVLASILGISCALGLFAEFRVSHDSFLRESNANAPLQLGASDTAPGRLVNTAAPFEFRFQTPPIADKAAEAPETLDRAVVIATPQSAPFPHAAVEAAGTPETPDHTAVVETPQPVPPAPSQPETETPAASAPAASTSATASDVNQTTAPASSDHAAEAPSPAATGSIAGQSGPQDTPQDGRQNAKPEAASDLAARTPAASPSAEETAPKTQIAPPRPSVGAPEKRRWGTLRRRPTIVRRFQRPRPAAATQDFTTLQPAFQWTLPPATQSPQPARRRVIIRRIRPVRKPVIQTTTPQTTVSTTSPVNPPE